MQLSGLNRQAKQVDILNDPRNRLIKLYYEMVGWFRPSFTLTEQVIAWGSMVWGEQRVF
jgi:hypothetical protein